MLPKHLDEAGRIWSRSTAQFFACRYCAQSRHKQKLKYISEFSQPTRIIPIQRMSSLFNSLRDETISGVHNGKTDIVRPPTEGSADGCVDASDLCRDARRRLRRAGADHRGAGGPRAGP